MLDTNWNLPEDETKLTKWKYKYNPIKNTWLQKFRLEKCETCRWYNRTKSCVLPRCFKDLEEERGQ